MTGRGFGALVAGVALLVAGLLLGWGSFQVVAALLLAGVAAALVSVFAVPHPRVSRTVSASVVQRGQPITANVTAAAPRRSPALAAAVVDRMGVQPVTAAAPFVRAGASRTVSYPLPTERRGVYQVGPLATVREDPFGLARWTRGGGGPSRVCIRPAVHQLEFRALGGSRSSGGDAAMPARTGSSAFHTLREYVPGDDRRLVHWRTSARLDKLMIKEGSEAAKPEVLVVLDARTPEALIPGAVADPFEETVDLVATLTAAACRAGLTVRLAATDGLMQVVAPSTEAVDRALDALAALDSTHEPMELGSIVRGRTGSQAVVVTTDGEAMMEQTRVLAARYRRVSMAVLGAPVSSRAEGSVMVYGAETAESWCARWATP